MTKLFAKWIFCIKENCPESGGGKCRRGQETADFPADGKCLFPEFIEYGKEWEGYGAYENEAEEAETEIEKRLEKCEAACHALVDEISKLQRQIRELDCRHCGGIPAPAVGGGG